jgi:hypothetical protein
VLAQSITKRRGIIDTVHVYVYISSEPANLTRGVFHYGYLRAWFNDFSLFEYGFHHSRLCALVRLQLQAECITQWG